MEIDMGSAVNRSPVKAILRALPAPMVRAMRRVQDRLRRAQAERAVAAFSGQVGRRHGLPGELIVTLTSYPGRYHCLHKTLISLLQQEVRPDRVILWLGTEPEKVPPSAVLELQAHGLEIRFRTDIRSYTKIIPAIEEFPDAYLVTADDDLYYESGWLRKIVDGFVPGEQAIVCRRAHRPKLEGTGLAPYGEWHQEILSDQVERCIFPTTGTGVLFPPGSLSAEVTDSDVFLDLCPHADDVWLFVMALRAGSRFKQVGGGCPQVPWEASQATSLMQQNLGLGGNDRQLSAVLAHYGETDRLIAMLKAPRS